MRKNCKTKSIIGKICHEWLPMLFIYLSYHYQLIDFYLIALISQQIKTLNESEIFTLLLLTFNSLVTYKYNKIQIDFFLYIEPDPLVIRSWSDAFWKSNIRRHLFNFWWPKDQAHWYQMNFVKIFNVDDLIRFLLKIQNVQQKL